MAYRPGAAGLGRELSGTIRGASPVGRTDVRPILLQAKLSSLVSRSKFDLIDTMIHGMEYRPGAAGHGRELSGTFHGASPGGRTDLRPILLQAKLSSLVSRSKFIENPEITLGVFRFNGVI